MLRDASQRGSGVAAPALAARCDAPQHEGRSGRCILAKRTQRILLRSSPRKRGPMITASGYGSRLSLRSAGTTIFHQNEGPTCGCKETIAGPDPLLRDCYLQWRTQLERVSRKRPSAYLFFPAGRCFGGGLYTIASSFMPSGSVK